jgi:hypothetical protein
MMRSSKSLRRPNRLLAGVGILLVLAISSAQAAHICCLDRNSGADDSRQPAFVAAPASICQICLGAQPAAAQAPELAQAPAVIATAVAAIGATDFYPNDTLFSLYIRPPPSR